MRIRNIKLAILGVVASLGFSLVSCGGSNHAEDIIINEVMASNRTGLLNDKNKPTDWIELKNLGKDSVDLKGFKLVVIKDTAAISKKQIAKMEKDDSEQESIESDNGNKKEKDPVAEWKFPSVKIGGGQCLVVFAGKVKNPDEIKSVQADLKFPKEGATIQLLAPNKKVVCEVKYREMKADQSLVVQPDSTYKATFWQSPGFENNREGFEAAMQKIDSQRKSPLLIWELMSRAEHSYENWVELKNVSDKPLELSEYEIGKKTGKNEGWQLPSRTLQPGEMVVVVMAGNNAKGNSLQAPFKLGNAETVVLTKGGKFVDGMNARLTQYGGSIGRKNGEKGFFFFNTPTPGEENSADGKRYIAEKPEWDKQAGIYKDQKQVVLKLANQDRKVHYTLDGSDPTMNSPVFKDSLVISKPTVVRSFAEGDSATMRSNIATASYMIGIDHDLPVINISLNPQDFYGHTTGIYADGPGYGGPHPYTGANFWKNWTKKAYMEMFDGKEGFSSDCGLKIFGAFSRALPKKSLRVKFRGQFGDSKVNFDFFKNGKDLEWEDLVLRSGSQDYNHNMIKDEFFTSLVQSGSPSLLTQMYRPVALYVNAEYFGLYYLREKIDKNFVARKLDLPNDSIDILLSGPSPYMTLVNQIRGMDMTKKENYDFAKEKIDFESLIDLKIGNIFAGKTDVGNTRHVRSRHPDSDRKWKYVYYDIDYSWSPNGKPSAEMYLSTAPGAIVPEKIKYNVMIDRLLKNKEFRQMFLERLSYHLTNTYAAKNTVPYFDNFISEIKAEMKHNCERWPTLSYEKWEKNISAFRDHFEKKPKIVLNDVRNLLHVTEQENQKYFSHLGY